MFTPYYKRRRGNTSEQQSFGSAVPGPPRALTAQDIESFEDAASNRMPGKAPTIYDLIAMCDALAGREPIRTRACRRYLRWLMKASDKHLRANWNHPWQK